MVEKPPKVCNPWIISGIFCWLCKRSFSEDFKVNDICGRLSADLITGEKAARELKLGKKRINGLEVEKADITNHYYHAKYYCQGYTKGNVGLGY